MKDEVVIDIPEFKDYRITNYGRVWSSKRGRFLSGEILPNGYVRISLSVENKIKRFLLHRLVLMSFCPNLDCNELQVNHKNGIKDDNRLDNLEWCTPSENRYHSYNVLGNKAASGESHGMSKLKDIEVLEIRRKYESVKLESIKSLSKEFNVSKRTIRDIIEKKSRKEKV